MKNLYKAIVELAPNINYKVTNDDINTLEWIDDSENLPTLQQIQDKVAELDAFDLANQYQENRKAEYPPITDYIDGVVKGDQDQIDKYIQDCLAVKAKYPKPTE